MSCGCWAKVRPKYKQLVLSVYPGVDERDATDAEVERPMHIKELTHYAVQAYPKKLPATGRYILKRIQYDLSYRWHRNVQLSFKAYDALLAACAGDQSKLSLFEDSVCNSVGLLLNKQIIGDAELLCIACSTLETLINNQDDASDIAKFEHFIPTIVELCCIGTDRFGQEAADAFQTSNSVRAASIRLATTLVRCFDEHSTAHFSTLVPSILANLERARDGVGFGAAVRPGALEIEKLAWECLRDMSNVSNPDIQIVLLPVFAYLDERGWADSPDQVAEHDMEEEKQPEVAGFVSRVLQTVARNARIATAQSICYPALQHLNSMDAAVAGSKGLRVRLIKSLVDVISHCCTDNVAVMDDSEFGLVRLPLGPWYGMLQVLLQTIATGSEPDAAAGGGRDSVSDEKKSVDADASSVAFVKESFRLIDVIAAELSSADSLSAVSMCMSAFNGANRATPFLRKSLVKAASIFARVRRTGPENFSVPDSLILTIVTSLLEEDDSDAVRFYLIVLLQNVTVATDNPDAYLAHDQEESKQALAQAQAGHGAARGPTRVLLFTTRHYDQLGAPALSPDQLNWIHTAVYDEMSSDSASPRSFLEALTLLLMLLRLNPVRSVEHHIPMLLQLQRIAVQRRESARSIPSISRGNGLIHSAVLVYLSFLARIFCVGILQEQANKLAEFLRDTLMVGERLPRFSELLREDSEADFQNTLERSSQFDVECLNAQLEESLEQHSDQLVKLLSAILSVAKDDEEQLQPQAHLTAAYVPVDVRSLHSAGLRRSSTLDRRSSLGMHDLLDASAVNEHMNTPSGAATPSHSALQSHSFTETRVRADSKTESDGDVDHYEPSSVYSHHEQEEFELDAIASDRIVKRRRSTPHAAGKAEEVKDFSSLAEELSAQTRRGSIAVGSFLSSIGEPHARVADMPGHAQSSTARGGIGDDDADADGNDDHADVDDGDDNEDDNSDRYAVDAADELRVSALVGAKSSYGQYGPSHSILQLQFPEVHSFNS